MARICEEEIRPARMMHDKQRCIEVDRRFLLDRRDRWVTVSCPACDGTSTEQHGEKQGFAYVQCIDCGTIYTNPRASLDLLHEFYSQSANYAYWNEHVFPATEEARRTSIFRPRAVRLLEYCHKYGIHSGTLLEVGAAFGTFCQEVRELNLFDRIIALEPTAGLANTCRQRGLEVLECFVEDIEESELADVVAAFEVVEHLFSPRDFLTDCQRILKPGGLVVLSCPNGQGFDVAALRMLSGTFDHEHVNYFNPRSLSMLARHCGFEVVDTQTPGQLDAELLRKQVLEGTFDLKAQPFLHEVLVGRWDELGGAFQQFLADHQLSSHLWLVARKPRITG